MGSITHVWVGRDKEGRGECTMLYKGLPAHKRKVSISQLSHSHVSEKVRK